MFCHLILILLFYSARDQHVIYSPVTPGVTETRDGGINAEPTSEDGHSGLFQHFLCLKEIAEEGIVN